MDDRRHIPRFDIDQPVSVKRLDLPGPFIPGRLVNFSAQGTRMILEAKVPPGALVRVEWGGTVLLGEVIYCNAEGNEFAAGLELEDAIYDPWPLGEASESPVESAGRRS
jgi:hypothetical protein